MDCLRLKTAFYYEWLFDCQAAVDHHGLLSQRSLTLLSKGKITPRYCDRYGSGKIIPKTTLSFVKTLD